MNQFNHTYRQLKMFLVKCDSFRNTRYATGYDNHIFLRLCVVLLYLLLIVDDSSSSINKHHKIHKMGIKRKVVICNICVKLGLIYDTFLKSYHKLIILAV